MTLKCCDGFHFYKPGSVLLVILQKTAVSNTIVLSMTARHWYTAQQLCVCAPRECFYELTARGRRCCRLCRDGIYSRTDDTLVTSWWWVNCSLTPPSATAAASLPHSQPGRILGLAGTVFRPMGRAGPVFRPHPRIIKNGKFLIQPNYLGSLVLLNFQLLTCCPIEILVLF